MASRKDGASLLAVLANVIGLSTLQVCGVGVPTCGASIGIGIVTAIFPDVLVNYFQDYAVWILIFSILIQIYSLYSLNCIFQKKSSKISS